LAGGEREADREYLAEKCHGVGIDQGPLKGEISGMIRKPVTYKCRIGSGRCDEGHGNVAKLWLSLELRRGEQSVRFGDRDDDEHHTRTQLAKDLKAAGDLLYRKAKLVSNLTQPRDGLRVGIHDENASRV
jgi:hypothetical protein